MTRDEATASTVTSAQHIDGEWTVYAADADGNPYKLRFEGEDTDTDEHLLKMTYDLLRKLPKQPAVTVPTYVTRDLSGQRPTDVKK